jgi:hypothetical protein
VNGNRHPGGTTAASPLDRLLRQVVTSRAASARVRAWARRLLHDGERAADERGDVPPAGGRPRGRRAADGAGEVAPA